MVGNKNTLPTLQEREMVDNKNPLPAPYKKDKVKEISGVRVLMHRRLAETHLPSRRERLV